MTSYGIDEDWNRLTPAELLAAGRTFVIGYVSEDTTGKNITAGEVRAYLAGGVDVLLVYEYSTTAVHGGAVRAHRDAAIAIAAARALGYPAGCAIAFAVDENTSSNPGVIDDYCRAFTADLHAAGWRSMVYGGLATVRRAGDLALVDLLWQTYAWSGSPTVWDPRVAIRQVLNGAVIAGKPVDLDTAMVDDFGQWKAESMTISDTDAAYLTWRVEALTHMFTTVREGPEKGAPVQLVQAIARIDAAVAADATRDAAMLAAIQALSAGGTSIDTAAVIAAVNTAGAGTSQAVIALHDELALVHAELDAAKAELDQLRAAAAAAAKAQTDALS